MTLKQFSKLIEASIDLLFDDYFGLTLTALVLFALGVLLIASLIGHAMLLAPSK